MSDNEQLMELYEQLLLLRHFDEFCYDLKMKDLIMNGFHPYNGQEAVAVGVCSLLERGRRGAFDAPAAGALPRQGQQPASDLLRNAGAARRR